MNGNVTNNAEESDCDASCCVRNLVVLYEGEEFREYLEHHAANYQLLHKHISITLRDVANTQSQSRSLDVDANHTDNVEVSKGESLLGYINSSSEKGRIGSPLRQWDGVVFPGYMVGALTESDQLWDWNDYLLREGNGNGDDATDSNSVDIQWADIQPFYRSQAQQYDDTSSNRTDTAMWLSSSSSSRIMPSVNNPDDGDRMTLYAPIGGDMLALFYRKDLFAKHKIKVPRTWAGYREVASLFHGKPWGPNNTTLIGSCVNRKRDRCNGDRRNVNAYWASLVLSTMTQAQGTYSGFLLDPKNLDPILGDAMEETLRILAEQTSFEDPNELIDCDHEDNNSSIPEASGFFNEGTCAMTYDWINQFTTKMTNADDNSKIGVARTPGSRRIFNRETKRLENCTPMLCPYGMYYDDVGIVNRPSYSAFGGWMGGVSNHVPSANQHAVADFFSYISNPSQSLHDVLPSERADFVSAFRYSHSRASDWTDAGLDAITASQLTETAKEVNSQNTVSEIRMPPGLKIRDILDQEVYRYLLAEKDVKNGNEESYDATKNVALRSEATETIDSRIKEALSNLGEPNVLRYYQLTLGYSELHLEGDSMNYIDTVYRDIGWCTSVLICSTSIGMIVWVVWNRNKTVMRAFQAFLNIQGAVGIFFMGVTLIPLGFDDSLFRKEVLDISCVVTPWIYVFGFTVFFSSIYSRIRCCSKIYNSPRKYDRMRVRPIDSFKYFCYIFLWNGILLGLWTYLDPLKWQRRENTVNGPVFPLPYGTLETFGSCRSDNIRYHGFAIALYVYNLLLCFVAMIEALRCRLLVLEYHQMQWLQLSILPFFEAWLVGGPVLLLVYERPTIQYVLFLAIIASSSIAAAFVIFAPKEWYVRKSNLLEFERETIKKKNLVLPESKPKTPPQPSPYGVRILSHPKVECLIHVTKLQCKLEKYKSSNTELAIDIRILHEKFRLLTGKEKLVVVKGMISKGTTGSQYFRPQSTSMSEEDDWFGLAKTVPPEDFDVLPMPEEDEEDENRKVNTGLTRGLSNECSERSGKDEENQGQEEGESDASPSLNSNKSPSGRSLSFKENMDKEKHEEVICIGHLEPEPSPQAHGDKSLNETNDSTVTVHDSVGSFVTDSEKKEINNERKPNRAESASPGSTERSPKSFHEVEDRAAKVTSSSFDEEAPIFNNENEITLTSGLCDEMENLDKNIDTEDFEELELETTMMAEQFKVNSTSLETISDLQSNIDRKGDVNLKSNGFHNLDTSNISVSRSTVTADNGSKGCGIPSDVQLGSPPRGNDGSKETDPVSLAPADESIGAIHTLASKSRLKNNIEEYSTQQHVRVPSSDRSRHFETHNSGVADKGDSFVVDGADDGASNGVLNSGMPIRTKRPKRPPTNHECGTSSSLQSLACSTSSPAQVLEAMDSQSGVSESDSGSNSCSSTIGGWTTTERMGILLADPSDSTSASAENVPDSLSSIELPRAHLQLNVPMAREIDKAADNYGCNAVKIAAEKSVDSSIDEEKGTPMTKISAARQKKRELESRNTSFGSS